MIKSFPFAGKYLGIGEDGFPKSDRDYNDEDLARYVSNIRLNGIIERDNNAMMVTLSGGREIRINFGSIHIKGRHAEIYDEPEYLTHDPGDSLPRIDLISMRLDLSDEVRAITPVIIRGVPAASPVMPELTRDDIIYDMILAKVDIPAGANSLNQSNITDTRRNKILCGMYNWTLDEKGSPGGVAPLDENGIIPVIYLPAEVKSKIGDIKLTTNPNMPPEWLYCNGSLNLKSKYPLLAPLFPSVNVTMPWEQVGADNLAQKIVGGNGYFVKFMGSTSLSAGQVYTSRHPIGPWTLNLSMTSILGSKFTPLKFIDGYFCILIERTLYFAADPTGTWSSVVITTNTSYEIRDITKGNGYWAAVGGTDTTHYIFFNHNATPAGNWSQRSNVFTFQLNGIEFGADYFIMWGNSNTVYHILNYPDVGTIGLNNVGFQISVAKFFNGYWVASVKGSTNYGGNFRYTTNPGATWNSNASISDTSPTVAGPGDVFYMDGYLFFIRDTVSSGDIFYLYGTNPAGVFTRVSQTITNTQIYSLTGTEGVWAFTTSNNTGSTGRNIYHNVTDGFRLPAVSIAGAYTFIKAKEAG